MSFENRYSTLDRMLHRLSFATPSLQIAVADLEDQVFAKTLDPIRIDRPVFVTALPRAGTTILLEAIESLPEFVSHTYRHMPFVLCPMFWSRFSARFQRSGEAQERAHQDGIYVTTDSPEAFEEMIWKAYFKKHYEKDRIRPWTRGDAEFFDLLRSHMRKIIALSDTRDDGTLPRYLSKNNTNIARIGLLRSEFPDAAIVVPFRNPLQHAASLLRQHRNFLDIHEHDRFAQQYMAGIGHYDFGLNLRPVDFGNWVDRDGLRAPESIGFWLRYWIETYRHLGQQEGIHLVCYEDLCARPAETLAGLGAVIQTADPARLGGIASRIRKPAEHEVATGDCDRQTLDDAHQLYDQLHRKSFRSQNAF